MIALDAVKGSVAAVLSAAVFLWYKGMSARQFGGITGDLAGWFLQVCELVMFLGIAFM
jgi:adenosylcobinamide-GDP ribazoletransferase